MCSKSQHDFCLRFDSFQLPIHLLHLSRWYLALVRLPLASFSDGRDSAPPERYTGLPKPAAGVLQNRYVGDFLLYGAADGWRRSASGQVYAVQVGERPVAYGVSLAHGVERIEQLGASAVVVGGDGKDLHFTSVRLAGIPVAVNRYTRANAAQGETRSHGFYYKPEDEHGGLLGLPVVKGWVGTTGRVTREEASLLFLRNDSLTLSELGTLDSRPGEASRNDGCRASCVDWYGNSRPLF